MKYLLAFFIGVISIAFVSCGGQRPEKSLTLAIGKIDNISQLSPLNTELLSIVEATSEPLLLYKDNEIILGAAKDMKISKDGLTYTFTLRDNLKWSDGAALTAYDYAFAWAQILKTSTAFEFPYIFFTLKNAKSYAKGEIDFKNIGLKTPDNKTIIFTLDHNIPYFAGALAFSALSPMRKDIVERLGDNYGTTIDGMVFSGPFVVSEWKRGNKITLTKNKNYHDYKNIALDKIVFLEIDNLHLRYRKFVEGALNVLDASGSEIKELKNDSLHKFNEYIYDAFRVDYLYFNTQKKLLQNKNIRLGLSLAINREGYVQSVLKSGTPAYGFVPFGIKSYNVQYRQKVPEPLKNLNLDAKALFTKGMEEMGRKGSSTITILMKNSDSCSRKRAEFLVNTWERALNINIEAFYPENTDDFIKKLNNLEFDLYDISYSADFDDPISFLGLFSLRGDLSTSFAKLNTTISSTPRLDLYAKIERLEVLDEVLIAPISYNRFNIFSNKILEGKIISPFAFKYQLRWLNTKG